MSQIKLKYIFIYLLTFILIILPMNLISYCQPAIQDNLYKHVNHEWMSKTILPHNESYYDDDIAMNSFLSILKGYTSNPNYINSNSEIGKAVNTYISLQDYETRNALGIIPLSRYIQQIDSINTLEDFANTCALLTKSGFDILNIRYLAKNNIPTIKIIDFNLDIYYPTGYNSNYEAYIKKLFSLIDPSNAHLITDQVVGLERYLAKFSNQNRYNEIKGADFETLITESKGNNFAQTFENAFSNQLGIAQNVKFSLKKDMVAQLQVVRSSDISLLRNFLKCSILRNCAGLLTQNIESSWSEHKHYYNVNKDNIHTKILQSSIGFCRLYGQVLIENILSSDKVFVNKIFDKVKKQYITNLENLKLQSENKIKKYINNIKISYGVPIDLQSGVDLPSVSSNSLINNIINLNAFNTAILITRSNQGQLFNYTQEKTYILANVDPNMAYDSTTQNIIFCPLIFNSSRYNSSLSSTEKWLTMAFSTSHEMGHSLDSKNVPNLAKKYNLSNSDVNVLSQTFAPISEQISNYSINISGKSYNMNPTRVLFEAVADLYGVQTVIQIINQDNNVSLDEFFKVYGKMRRSIETDEELKSIIQREFHPPNEYRVNKTVANFEELYKTYNIGIYNGMYIPPDQRAIK